MDTYKDKESKARKGQASQHSLEASLQVIDRRGFVRLTGLAAVSALAGGAAGIAASTAIPDVADAQTSASAGVPATLSIQNKRVENSVILDSRFASLSLEKSSINRTPVYLSGDNTDLVGLLNALGGGVLRIGANSVDETTWTPTGAGETSGQVAPSDIDNFASLIRKCRGWKVIYGVNMFGKDGSTASPELAAGEAAHAAQQLGYQLLAFEIGNEPDLYGEGISYDIFLNGGTTSTGTTFAGWNAVAAAIRAAVPHAVFTGPAASSDSKGWAEDFAPDEVGKIALLTEHYYVSNYSSAAPSIAGMLTYPGPGIVAALQKLQTAAAANSMPFRIDECNSYFSSKNPAGVANAFASALWAIDFIFTNAQYGSSGVNFHNTGNTSGYAAIGETSSVVTAVQPLYYALFLFAHMFDEERRGVLLESTLTASGVALSAFAVGTEGGTYAVLNNKDTTNTASVTISGFPFHATRAEVRTLASAGSTPSAQLGNLGVYNGGSPITFGGEAVALDGRWFGRPEEVRVDGDGVTVNVAPASAALVFVRSFPGFGGHFGEWR
jgi:hypothetical protein